MTIDRRTTLASTAEPRTHAQRRRIRRGTSCCGVALALVLASGCTRAPSEPAPEGASPPAAAAVTCRDRIRIDFSYPGASAFEVETLVVLPVEAAVQGIAKIEHIDAIAREQGAVIWLEVSGDAMEVSAEVRTALQGLSALPPEVEAPWISVRQSGVPHVVVTVRGPAEARERAGDDLEHALLAVKGIRRIERRGRITWGVTVDASPERLTAMGLALSDLTAATERALTGLGPPIDLEGLGKLVIAERDGIAVRLADVAEIRLERDAPTSQAWIGNVEGEVWRVDADEPAAIRSAAAEVTLPPGVVVEVAGELRERGCPSGGRRVELAGDFSLFELRLPDARDPRSVAELVGRAPTIADAVWWTGTSLLDDDDAGEVGHVEVLLPAADEAAPLRTWLGETSGVEWLAERGPRQAQVVVELEHADVERLHAAAEWLDHTARRRGFRVDGRLPQAPHVAVHLDREAMARLGLAVHDVSSRVQAAYTGTLLGMIRDGDGMVMVRLAEPPGNRGPVAARLDRLDLVRLRTPTGAEVPLSAVASIEHESQPSEITRHDRRRIHDVEMSVLITQLDTAVELVDRTFLPELASHHPDVQARRSGPGKR